MLRAAVATASLFILCGLNKARSADDPAAPNLAPATPPVSTGLPAVPDAGAQEQANKLLRQLFGAEIDAARTPQAKVDLARKLLQQGIDSRDDPAGRYVLLTKAKDLAIAVGDPPLAMQAVDEITRSFRIDGTALGVEALTALSKLSLNPNLSKGLAEATAAALDGAIAADKFEAAKPLVTIGVAASKKTKDAELIRQWLARGKDVDELQAAYEAVKDAIAKLDAKPLDAAANTAVGRYRILSKGDWDGGIPMLALGDDAALQTLAARELADPDTAEDQLKLADGWWEFAETQDPATKDRVQARALFWYDKALPSLAGLNKARVEKRLQDLRAKIFAKVQAAARGKRWQFTAVAGNANGRGANFLDVPEEGVLLVGFEVGVQRDNAPGGAQYIKSIRPIFMNSKGEENNGSQHGDSFNAQTIHAKEGYAVAGLTVRATNRIDGLSVTFMQIQGTGLSTHTAYSSEWYGSRTAGAELRLGGNGQPAIGLGGKANNNRGGGGVEALALVLTR